MTNALQKYAEVLQTFFEQPCQFCRL